MGNLGATLRVTHAQVIGLQLLDPSQLPPRLSVNEQLAALRARGGGGHRGWINELAAASRRALKPLMPALRARSSRGGGGHRAYGVRGAPSGVLGRGVSLYQGPYRPPPLVYNPPRAPRLPASAVPDRWRILQQIRAGTRRPPQQRVRTQPALPAPAWPPIGATFVPGTRPPGVQPPMPPHLFDFMVQGGRTPEEVQAIWDREWDMVIGSIEPPRPRPIKRPIGPAFPLPYTPARKTPLSPVAIRRGAILSRMLAGGA